MKRAVLVAGLLVATATTASAGGFIGLGVGGSPGTSGSAGYDANGRSGRLEIGYSFGNIAVEGMASRADMFASDSLLFNDTSLAIAGTYHLPLSSGFGAYGRVGLQHSSLTLDSQYSGAPDPNYSGSGILFGGGFDFKLPLAAANLALFVDYTIATANLTMDGAASGSQEYGLTTRTWTLGAKLGF